MVGQTVVADRSAEILRSLLERPGSVLIIQRKACDITTGATTANASDVRVIRFDGQMVSKKMKVFLKLYFNYNIIFLTTDPQIH